MKTILVTGGAGFIGSHTCVELINNGYDVCIVDSLINSSETNILNIRKIIKTFKGDKKGKLFFRKGDLRDKKFLEHVFEEFKYNNKSFDSVVHFAGLKSVEDSVNNPLKYWDLNINSTLCVLEIMNKFKCYNFVFSSSATIYLAENSIRLKENSPKKPINPYGNTKFTIERILEDLFQCNSDKWKIANLRYFNPAGGHDSGLIGENPLNSPSNLFPVILKVAKQEYKELSIFGNNWPTKDGTCIRDYIHVMDLADAHIAALEYLIGNDSQLISLNIGTGIGTSVMEIVNKFIEVNKVLVPYKFKNRRVGDQAFVVADNSLALNLLDWYPKRNIDDMCFDSWRWLNLDEFNSN